MFNVQSPESKVEDDSFENLQIIDGELLEVSSSDNIDYSVEEQIEVAPRVEKQIVKDQKPKTENQKFYLQYILLPLIFLTAALLGGLRLSATDSALIFLKPPLICLIFATILLVLFFRSGLLKLEGWFSESFSMLKNTANVGILLTLFFASTQIFNSLLPETGLPFWVFAFCFFWTLWNNLFVEFQGKRLLQSLGSVFALAFVSKYLILAYLTAPTSESWWRGILENPTQEFFTLLFDLPRFAAGTGYIQFFAVIFYLLGLFLLPPVSAGEK
ncbi:MAG: hypothetical protein H0V31_05270 [Acidobacteria bacterium]|nr:hypothetical protein [Acidobacteriota bacterium]